MALDKTNKVDEILIFHNRILGRALQLFYRNQEVNSFKKVENNRSGELQRIETGDPVLDGGVSDPIQPDTLQAQSDPSSEVSPTPPSTTPCGTMIESGKDEVLIVSKPENIEIPQYKGVSFNELMGEKPWRAHIDFMGRDELIGDFKTAEEAALAYNKMAVLYFGKNTELNKL